MTKLNIYNIKGTKVGTAELPKELGEKVKLTLLSQAWRVYADRTHPGLAKVKTRGFVVSSTKKIYRQKGTGGARHGARSAPIFVGGGVVHGPTGVKRTLKLSRKMRRFALKGALSLIASEGRLHLAEGVSGLVKTKEADKFIKSVIATEQKVQKNPNILVVLANNNLKVATALKNISGVSVLPFAQLNAYSLLHSNFVILDKDALDEKKTTKKEVENTTKKDLTKVAQKKVKQTNVKKKVVAKKNNRKGKTQKS